MIQIMELQSSPRLDPLPELDADDRSSVLLHPTDFPDWPAALAAAPDVDDYILAPGDYRGWGPCKIKGAAPAGRRRLIRFERPQRRPWDRMPDEAVVRGFEFQDGAAHWIVHGVTLRGPDTSACIVRPGAEHITFDSLLIEDFGAYGARLFGNHCIVQNCVIRRMAPEADGAAVQIKVRGGPNVGARVLDNEIYDCNDGVGVTWDTKKGADRFMECRDLIVEGNDIYLTESRHVEVPGGCYAEAENAIDIKAGPRSSPEPLKFLRNRIWGFRRTAPVPDGRASDGAAVTIHRGAQRILFEDNVIFDCPIAFHEVVRDHDDPNQGPREVTVRSTIISLMCPFNPEDPGAVLRTRLSFRLEGNVFSHSHLLSTLSRVGAADVYTGNVLHDTHFGKAEAEWNAGVNIVAPSEQMNDVLVERRRWTRRDRINLHRAVLSQPGAPA
jgi:hypothetical protein